MPRINQLPAAQSVGATDVVAVDTENGTKRVPKSTLFDGYQTTAWSNNWLTNTSILTYAASVATPSFTTFRTSATSTDVPIANEYYIGTVERYGQNITVKMTTMQDASKMYINNSVNGGSTWTGWKTFLDSQSTAYVDCGMVTGSTVTDAIGAAWDAITTYDKTVFGKFVYQGQWMFMAYKYSGSTQYGMMIAVKYNSTPYLMRVTSGAKTYFTFGITQVT